MIEFRICRRSLSSVMGGPMAASPADEPAPWEPVITRPDPMTAEEWEASLERDLAEDLDPDDLAWEDDFWCPDADLTEAELAEIAAAMDARAEAAPGAARQLKAAGLEGDMDQLRARAFLDLLTGTDSRPRPGTGQHGTSQDGRPGPGPASPGPDGPAHSASLIPARYAARGNLTIPLVTLLGLADRPGQLAGTPIDPWLARDLAHAAAASPATTWCVTVTDQHGHATWHACARPAPASRTNHRKRGSPRSPGATGNRDGPQAAVGFTRTSRDGPPGGFGTWTLTVHGREF